MMKKVIGSGNHLALSQALGTPFYCSKGPLRSNRIKRISPTLAGIAMLFTVIASKRNIIHESHPDTNFQKGFTLTEMLVTIAVLTLLMTVTTINFRSSEQNELLRLSARRIGEALQQIQTYAQAGTGSSYPQAKSYGVHINTDAPQTIVQFADINTSSADAAPRVGRWDGGLADAEGKKDEQIGEARILDAGRKGRVILDSITVAYVLKSGAVVSAGCAKDENGVCIKDSSGNFLKKVRMVDIAAEPPLAHMLASGGADFPADPSGIIVRQIIFDVKDKQSDRHKLVTMNLLSGRIDVEY